MYFGFNDSSITYCGRWEKGGDCAITTACGNSFVISFRGDSAVLRFDTIWSKPPHPHIYLSVDGGSLIEATIECFLRVRLADAAAHTIRVIYKSAMEIQHRWYEPLEGKLAFYGYDAEAAGEPVVTGKKTIEFVGDSITEGVLIDEEYTNGWHEQLNRVFQDDVTATYAYMTAERLGLDAWFAGYGFVGILNDGCGAVPKALESYPCYYHGKQIDPELHPDFVLINHGTNDCFYEAKAYCEGYVRLLGMIRALHPDAGLIALTPFNGTHADALKEKIAGYNAKTSENVLFIDSRGWVPPGGKLHPDRAGHRAVADRLVPVLKKELML